MSKHFDLVPEQVQPVETAFRRIQTPLPAPQSLPLLQQLYTHEARAMRGQPPVVWDRAEGLQVYDPYGNMWLDFSSGVLVTNAGHSHPRIVQAITRQADAHLLTSYCFPNARRAELAQRLVELAPSGLDRVFLLSTGAETVEGAIKLARTYGARIRDDKIVIISFDRSFHGRTLGAQQVGGFDQLKSWIKNLDPDMVQVPFPDGYHTENTSFELFETSLRGKHVDPARVAGVIMETYQGSGASFAPPEYVRRLRAWCDRHRALLILDEVQAAFGRCGTLWGFEVYRVVPDLMCLGKGLSSSLPISALVGRREVMDLYGPNEMTSTHTGNPVCAAAALAAVEAILAEDLIANAARVGAVLHGLLDELQQHNADVIGAKHGRGLVAGVHMTNPRTKRPDGDLAWDVVRECFRRGLLMFAPVGVGGSTIKICPPLCITEPAVHEGVRVLGEAIEASRRSG